MRDLPKAAQACIWSVVVSGAVLLTWLLPTHLLTQPLSFLLTVTATIAIFVAETHPIPISYKARISVSAAVQFGALLALGPGPACWANAIGTGLALVRLGRKWYNVGFNIGTYTLSIASASFVYTLISRGEPLIFLSVRNFAAVILAGATFYALNLGLLSVIISLRRRRPLWYTCTSILKRTATEYSAMILLGTLTALVYYIAWWALILVGLPIVIVHYYLRASEQLQEQTTKATMEAVEALADAIDSRDPYTFGHSRRVAEYAAQIARQMKLPEYDVGLIRLSARAHDLGKMGISDVLLCKPGQFTARERKDFKQHVVIGARIVSRFQRYQEGKDIILYHHEWYDGNGYLNGLKGDQIPIGARIIAVADAYDAMTSDRPYRPALSPAQACQELLRYSGCQFDPTVVRAFLKALNGESWGPSQTRDAAQAIPPTPAVIPISSG